MTMVSPKKRAVIYARYSSDMQKATSIDGQILLCRKVAERNNLDVIGEFVDAAKSGLTEDARDGYQRLLDGVRSHDFDVIIVEHFDRLSRDPATIQRLKQIFEFNRVELMDQKGIYATATDISIASLYNTIYKPQLAEKVRRGHDNAVVNGKIPARMLMAIGRRLERRVSVRSTRMRRRSYFVFSRSTPPVGQPEILPPISRAKACLRPAPLATRTKLVARSGIISASRVVVTAAASSATSRMSA